MSAVTFDSLAERAAKEMEDYMNEGGIWTSWNDILVPPCIALSVKASWWAIGKSDSEIKQRIMEKMRERMQDNG